MTVCRPGFANYLSKTHNNVPQPFRFLAMAAGVGSSLYHLVVASLCNRVTKKELQP